MVAALLPVPRVLQDRVGPQLTAQIGRDPDMIEPPPAIGLAASPGCGSTTTCTASRPAARNGAPRRRSRSPCQASSRSVSGGVWLTTFSSCLWLQTSCSSGAMFRSPTSDRRARASLRAREPGARLVDEIELVAELHVLLAIRNVAARRDVEVVQFDRAALGVDAHAQVAAVALPAPVRRGRARLDRRCATGSRHRCSPSSRGTRRAG